MTRSPSLPAKRRSIEERVREWPRAYQELWVERSGILMDSGASQSQADQAAYVWTRRAMKAQGGA